ncbi:MAG: hypothetical protein GXC72_01800 [Chitinophagaceae bacterium]|nr:hypothetical protein [Chitinophagaceae bacterium]
MKKGGKGLLLSVGSNLIELYIMVREVVGKYLSYLAVLFFSWVLIGQLIQANLVVDNLNKISGTIDTTMEITLFKSRSKEKYHELRIFINEKGDYFRLMDTYDYPRFLPNIKRGDSAEIYIRPKWLTVLGMGYGNDIFQMAINGKVVFEISETRKTAKGIAVIAAVAIPVFAFLAALINRALRKHRRLQPTSVLQKLGDKVGV